MKMKIKKLATVQMGYICAASGTCLPVYRLRYNPNIEQSMKGDDVLAFDFTSKRALLHNSELNQSRPPYPE